MHAIAKTWVLIAASLAGLERISRDLPKATANRLR
jgi:hypothetical protein